MAYALILVLFLVLNTSYLDYSVTEHSFMLVMYRIRCGVGFTDMGRVSLQHPSVLTNQKDTGIPASCG